MDSWLLTGPAHYAVHHNLIQLFSFLFQDVCLWLNVDFIYKQIYTNLHVFLHLHPYASPVLIIIQTNLFTILEFTISIIDNHML